MLKAQARAKTSADQVRSFREFEVGDMVFLKVTPKKSQLGLGKCYKLSPNIVGHPKFSKWEQWLMN
jgi:ribosomal protein L21E